MRAELAAVEPARACCRAAERAGLGAAASGRARSPVVARLAVRLEDGSAASRGSAARSPGSLPSRAPSAGAGSLTGPGFDWTAARDHCRVAWLRGRFVAHGSLSLAEGRTHLEFVLQPDDAALLAVRLADIGLPVRWRLRRGRGVVTWKGLDRVVTFLRRVGASASVLELEARLVTRQLHGQLNCVLNAENANLGRAVAASRRQALAIEALEAEGRLATLTAADRDVARLRLAEPAATLAEIAAELGISRSRVQRAFERIERTAGPGRGGPPASSHG